MKDQVGEPPEKGITAYSIDSGMSRKDVINILKVATESNCKFLYVSPERLEHRSSANTCPASSSASLLLMKHTVSHNGVMISGHPI